VHATYCHLWPARHIVICGLRDILSSVACATYCHLWPARHIVICGLRDILSFVACATYCHLWPARHIVICGLRDILSSVACATYFHLWPARHIGICGLRDILSSVVCPALQTFSSLAHKRHDLKKILNKMCVLNFSTSLSQKFLILRRTERYMIKNVYWCSCKVPVILGRC
jgi:hypothetical protein